MRAGCPMGSNGGHEGPPRGSGARLLLATALCVALSASAHAATPLRTIVEDVPGSTAHSYGTRDNVGNSMHTLKVVKSPLGGYLGVYHTVIGTRYVVKVATSLDLLNWRFEANLAVDASQPTIYSLKRGAALVAYETHAGCPGAKRCLVLRHYATESALLSGAASEDHPPAAHAVELRRGDAEHLLGHEQPEDRGRRLPLLPGLPRRPPGKGHAASTSTRRRGRRSRRRP